MFKYSVKTASDRTNPRHPYPDENSDASSHQMGKGHRDHIGLGVADKNGQAGGGLVNYFSDQAAEQQPKEGDPNPTAGSYFSFDEQDHQQRIEGTIQSGQPTIDHKVWHAPADDDGNGDDGYPNGCIIFFRIHDFAQRSQKKKGGGGPEEVIG